MILIIIRNVLLLASVIYVSGCIITKEITDQLKTPEFVDYESSGHSIQDMAVWWWEMDTVEWPEWINDPPQPAPEKFVGSNRIKFTYINQATVLIQMDSINILTDPIWSDYAGPVSWLAAKRVRAPGIKIEDLPSIDYILISHDHFDHLDRPTLAALAKKYNPVVLTGIGVSPVFESDSVNNVTEMDWWDEYTSADKNIKITFVPARHQSGRSLFGNNRTLWGGFVIEGNSGRVYFAGDTGFGKFLFHIKEKFKSFDLAILPVGNYEKRWFMKN